VDEVEFPYKLPFWRDSYQLKSPDGTLLSEISHAGEASMGNPICGILRLYYAFGLDGCNPSFIWSDDSRYLVIPRYLYRFELFRRQHLLLMMLLMALYTNPEELPVTFKLNHS